MRQEVWKDIAGYEGAYQVSNMGRIKSLPRKHKASSGGSYMTKEIILKPAINKNGYKHVSLFRKDKRVHRLVAEAFLPNIKGLRDVNHKNGDKQDNTTDNLEWVSHSQNELHKIHILKTPGKFIHPMRKVTCIENNKTYNSIAEACRDLGIKTSHIPEVCQGKISQTCGYHWRYA